MTSALTEGCASDYCQPIGRLYYDYSSLARPVGPVAWAPTGGDARVIAAVDSCSSSTRARGASPLESKAGLM